jgi:hypothetical protein
MIHFFNLRLMVSDSISDTLAVDHHVTLIQPGHRGGKQSSHPNKRWLLLSVLSFKHAAL